MIISHKYKYVFLELPHTGTRAINRELVEHYDGERVLSHHSNLYDFRRRASKSENSYFTFSAIRNPLDITVSQYFKYKRDSAALPGRRKKKRRIHERLFDYRREQQIRFLDNPDVRFSDYFRKFYRLPYDNWSSVCHPHCDYVVRFESIQEDFARVLSLLNVPQVRPIPKKGKTTGRTGHFSEFYEADVRQQAVNVFGPFMELWGYKFPADWGDVTMSPGSRAFYSLLGVFRHNYWKYLRPYL